VAFEKRLRNCRNVVTLGVCPNLADYEPWQRELIREADTIYYPTEFYADILDTLGKRIFPSYHTYKFTQDKIKQTALFDLLGIQHPKTRVFYGSRQKSEILDHFHYPFVAKTARGSALGRGVFLIKDENDLSKYLALGGPAYIQEYIHIDRDLRVVVVGGRAIHAYWRVSRGLEFRTNVSQGGQIYFKDIPQEGISFAVRVARLCRIDDAGFDIFLHNGSYGIFEMNMKYGKEGFRTAGIDYDKLLERMIENDEI
jgi:ribosomal protein S6--L-glutamate ligase